MHLLDRPRRREARNSHADAPAAFDRGTDMPGCAEDAARFRCLRRP